MGLRETDEDQRLWCFNNAEPILTTRTTRNRSRRCRVKGVQLTTAMNMTTHVEDQKIPHQRRYIFFSMTFQPPDIGACLFRLPAQLTHPDKRVHSLNPPLCGRRKFGPGDRDKRRPGEHGTGAMGKHSGTSGKKDAVSSFVYIPCCGSVNGGVTVLLVEPVTAGTLCPPTLTVCTVAVLAALLVSMPP